MRNTYHPAPRAVARLLSLAVPAALALALPTAAAGQATSDLSGVAVVDAGRIFRESEVGKTLLEGLKVLRESKRGEREGREARAKELQDQITQGRLSLSADKLAELEKELEDQLIALERFDSDSRREIDKASEEAMTRFNNRIMPVIEELGEEQGLTLIFNKFEAGLLFAHDRIDITQEVIERFDALAGAAPGSDATPESDSGPAADPGG